MASERETGGISQLKLRTLECFDCGRSHFLGQMKRGCGDHAPDCRYHEWVEDDCKRTAGGEREGDATCDCPYCQDGEMFRDGSKVVCDNCGQVKLA